MMVKALSTWRNMTNKLKVEDFETVIQKKWPQIMEEQWKQFIKSHKCPDFNKKSVWGEGHAAQDHDGPQPRYLWLHWEEEGLGLARRSRG
jgi:hypothetical protein